MSAFDYSKWDNIEDSDDDIKQPNSEDIGSASSPSIVPAGPREDAPKALNATLAAAQMKGGGMKSVKPTKKGKEGRFKFEYEGRTIYEWEQSLDEVNIYIEPPAGVPPKLIKVDISHRHLVVGLKTVEQPFIDEATWGGVKVDESMWTFTDGEININLQKMNKAEAWDAALLGRDGAEVDPAAKEEVKRALMLERFQEEHPGFDFSNATFNGDIPSARDFMGGVKYG